MHGCSIAILSLFTQEAHFPYNFDHNDEDLPQEAIRICLSEQRVVLAKPIMIPLLYVLALFGGVLDQFKLFVCPHLHCNFLFLIRLINYVQ
jgi:hypothetical protein